MENYKQRLYDQYVSTGQASPGSATVSGQADGLFRGQAPYMEKRIRPHLPDDRKAPILDLGCGHGTHIYFLKKWGFTKIVGIDTSAEQVALAHQLGLTEVRLGDVRDVPATQKGQVGAVLLIDVIEHLTLDVTFDILTNVYDLLTAGGRLILHVPNAEGLFGMRIRYGDLTHETAFTPTSIRQLLKSVGFVKFDCYEDKPVIYNLKSVFRRLIWEFGTFSTRLLLMAETGQTNFILSQNMLVVAEK
jgi:2-polyprenyl-3-methyl-5-hydroxy-6-metoxy-1,4-benzoquinol methylase